jgi:DNA-binding NarL/FixJ family response regulator
MKILLVDDHIVVREGVRRLLSSIAGAQLLEAERADDALNLVRAERPDLVVLDLNLEGMGGLELLRRILSEDDKARVVVFSMHAEVLYAVRSLRLGARGYVSKSAGAEELVNAVKRVAGGGRYVEQHIADQIAFTQVSSGEDPLRQLTPREVEILRLLGDGNSLTEIAGHIGVAYKTVANACSALKSKLGVERTADLIRVSLELR